MKDQIRLVDGRLAEVLERIPISRPVIETPAERKVRLAAGLPVRYLEYTAVKIRLL